MAEKHVCVHQMWSNYGFRGSYRDCGKTAMFDRDGKWYCGIHDPVAIAERLDARNAAINAKWEARLASNKAARDREAERDRRAAMFDELVAALEKIAAIENEQFGGDWDEIEAARLIAITVLAKAKAAL
jgi:uncharacterized Zn finger protein (UPF0148 family)